jgi:hypothetical protein
LLEFLAREIVLKILSFSKITVTFYRRNVFFTFFSKWLLDVSYGCCPDYPGTRWTRTADPSIAGLVTYPLDHEALVDMIISELPDEL